MTVPLHNQINVSGAAQQLSTVQGVVAVIAIKAPLTNLLPVYIGSSAVTSANGYQLDPGDTMEYESKNQNLGSPEFMIAPYDLWVVGTAPDKVTWLASP